MRRVSVAKYVGDIFTHKTANTGCVTIGDHGIRVGAICGHYSAPTHLESRRVVIF